MGRITRRCRTVGVHGKSGVLPTFAPLSFRYRNTRAALMTCTALCAVITVAVTPLPAMALPQNGQVVSGTAKIITKGDKVIVIEKSANVVIDWSSFNIAAGEKVIFVQASSLDSALNQILGAGASQILGQIVSKGTVIITNPNGVVFGATANVKVGAIVVTTAVMSAQAQAQFMAGGKLNFDIASTSPNASVINRGSITAAEAGLVGLVAPGVENSGIIQARLGTVQLAAGNTFTLDLYGDKLIKLAPGDKVLSQVLGADGSQLKALVDNSGTISADGGTIILTANAAKTIVTNIINMDGIAQARSVGTTNGEIVLDGGEAGIVQVAGTLDASGKGAGQTGGTVKVLGDKVGLFDGARIDVAGDMGGGAVAVGGDFHGAGPDRNASATYVASSAVISADALTTGNGGQVAVWADGYTNFNGAISAKGGALGGNGGFVETSGKLHLSVGSTATVDTSASKGTRGTWLLDPDSVTIDQDGNENLNGDSFASPFTPGAGNDDVVGVSTLVTALNGSDVTISATNDITVSTNIDSSGGGLGNLTLTSSSGKIKLGADIITKGNQNYVGAVLLNNSLTLNSSASNGNVSFSTTVDSDAAFRTLTVYAGTGNVGFGGAVGGINKLGGLLVTGSAMTLGGNVSTAGWQSYTGAVLLSASDTLTAQNNIDFSSTVDAVSASAQGLVVSTTTNVTFSGAVGGGNKLSSLSVTGNKILLGGNVTTSGNQAYTGAVILTGAMGVVRTLDSSTGNGNVNFSSTVNAAQTDYQGLVVNAGTGNVAYGGAIGGTTGLLNVAVTGSHITLGGNVSTGTPGGRYTAGDGNQTYSGAVILGASTTLDVGGPGNLAFSSTVDGTTAGGQGLTISESTNSVFGGSVGGNTRLASLEVIGTSDINLGGNVTTSGNQRYASSGHTYLTSDVTMDTSVGNGNVYFFGTVSSLATTPHALTIAAGTGNVTFNNPVGDAWTTLRSVLSSLAVTGGDITLNRYVKTSGNQTYNGHVISGNTNGEDLDSSAGNGNIYFASVDGATADSNNLSLKAGTGNITIGGAVGANTRLSWVSATGSNITLGGNVSTGWAQTYTGKVILSGNAAMDTSTHNANVTFTSTVDATSAGGQSLAITSGTGNISFGGAVGGGNALASMAVTGGNITLGGNVTTNTNQTYGGAVILTANDTLDSLAGNYGNVSFSSTLNSDGTARALTIASSGNVTFGGVVGGGNKLASMAVSGRNITFGGNVTTNGNQTYNGNRVIVAADDTLDSSAGNGNIAFLSALESDGSARALTIASGTGSVIFNAAVGGTNALSSLNLTGSSVLKLGVNVTTTGNQTYAGAVVLNNAVILDSSAGNGNVSFGSTLDSDNAARNVTIAAGSGNVGFGGAVGGGNALASMAVTGGNITLGGNVTTNTNQTYTGKVILVANDTLDSSAAGGNIAFSSTVDATTAGTQSLTLAAGTGNVAFGGAVGATNRLASLTATGGNVTIGGNVTTSGNQAYSGAVVLSAADTLDSSNSNGNISFTSSVDSDGTARALTITSGTGNVTFGAAEGLLGSLSSLVVTGSTISLNGNVTTTGNQTYTGAVLLPIGSRMRSGAGNVAFSSTVDAGTAAATQTLTVYGFGNVSFGGAVGGINKFASLIATETNISLGGNVTTSGSQNYNGAVILGANDTLDSSAAGGNIAFSSTVDSASATAKNLTLAAGTGNVSFGGAVGATNKVSLLQVNANAISLSDNVTANSITLTSVILANSLTMTANQMLLSNIDGNTAGGQSLTLLGTGGGAATLSGALGDTTRLASLSASNFTSITIRNGITTSGNQTYGSPTQIRVTSATLDSSAGNGNVAFTSTLDARDTNTESLIINAGSGNVDFGGAVGATTALVGLAVTGGKVTLGGNVTTSGNQTFTGPVVLSATDTLNSSAGNGNVAFSSTVDGTTVSQQGLTVTSGTGNVPFGGIVGGIKALLSRTVNGATMSTGKVAAATPTTTTAAVSQTTNNVVNTISTIVGGSSSGSSGSTSPSPSSSVSSSGGGTRLAFATDVFSKDYKLVSISPALSQQNPSSNSAGSSLFGGSAPGGNTTAAATGGNGGANSGGEQGVSGSENDGRGENNNDRRSR